MSNTRRRMSNTRRRMSNTRRRMSNTSKTWHMLKMVNCAALGGRTRLLSRKCLMATT
jgi:hypothetical protein